MIEEEKTSKNSQDWNNNSNDSKINDVVEINKARFSAVKIISRFERSDAYLNKLLKKELDEGNLSSQDKSLLTELVNGVIRWRWKLDWVLTGFYRGDYLKCLNIVKNSLRVGLYQILFLDRVPVHAAINESVEMIKRIQGEKIAGVVNGVLRNISRNIENIRYPSKEADMVYYYTIMKSHPRWMVKRWIELFGEEDAVKLLDANNQRPYTTIRINLLKCGIDEVKNSLTRLGINFQSSLYAVEALTITSRGVDISSLDLFKDGKIAIQDTSALSATKLANAKSGHRILDLCSAPGGKSFSLAEQSNDSGVVIAVDKYPSKLRFIKEGAERLGLKSIQVLEADASDYDFDELFDIVFADVPCSGLGTLSKKPDIKWKREREDIGIMVNTQRAILDNAARFVKPGGALIYSTCTIEPKENEENISYFLKEHPEFQIDSAEKYLPVEICKNGFMQTLQHIHNTDGAFAARLIKQD
ncbi:16S rRNA (cytosine(967)-C(5))-methyltransferase RsmB [Bacteroidota bacterium]